MTHHLMESFIKGAWRPVRGKERFTIEDPFSLKSLGEAGSVAVEEVDEAVEAATQVFPTWSTTTPKQRANALKNIAAGLRARKEELTMSIVREVGCTYDIARDVQVEGGIGHFQRCGEILETFSFEDDTHGTPVLKEAAGVAACISPWNFPLLQIGAKVAPALAAGCTVVLKPSEVAPSTAFILAEVIEQLGLPDGVFNLVLGKGPTIGEALVRHPGVDIISFTGSTAAGRRIGAVAAERIKRVTMELGGKSSAVILDDASLEDAVAGTLATVFINAGQSCTAHSRLLIPRPLEDDIFAIAKQQTEAYTLGDPAAPQTKLGPVISEAQWQRVQRYIEAGEESDAIVITGGSGKPAEPSTGHFVKPTVFGRVQSRDLIAQEEIFGPVLSIISYDTEEEAVALANDTIYGLSGGVWSNDRDRAMRIARRMRTGTVEVNGGTFNGMAPFGGYRQSGIGREYGTFALDEFLELKTLQV